MSDFKTLQKVLLPRPDQLDIQALYVDGGEFYGIHTPEKSLKQDTKQATESESHAVAATERVDNSNFISNRSTHVPQGKRISFATYFNAFPASYWKRWTNLSSVRLHIETEGEGIVSLHKSTGRGTLQQLEMHTVSGASTLDIDLPLKPFGDGGWYWFDLISGKGDFTLVSAEWQSDAPVVNPEQQGITLEITTMNKVDYCLNNLRSLGTNPEALDLFDEILLVDQGTQKVQEHPDFEEAVAPLKGKFRIINQSNLGGSGGFARGMYEAVENGSKYALLLDDDVVLDPDSIVRMHTFAEHTRKPTLVGGHMFDVQNRAALHTMGEKIDPYRFFWGQADENIEPGHNFALSNLRATPWMHRRVDVDYNGWWMDLIPTDVIREIGLPLPVFIKWDDAEYGYRATLRGYPTVTFPGAAVWHMSWLDKDDTVGWQAYFHARNRFIAALSHSPYKRGGRLLKESVFNSVKHLLSMQYSTESIRILALKDVLAGPDKLHEHLATRLPVIRQMLQEFSDAQFNEDIDSFPQPRAVKPLRPGLRPPTYAQLPLWTVKTAAKQLLKPVSDEAKQAPQAQIPHQDNRWWRTAKYDSVLVSNAEGSAVSWYKRRPEVLRAHLSEGTQLTAQIMRQWPELSKQYRAAFGKITSFDEWGKTFEKHTESELKR